MKKQQKLCENAALGEMNERNLPKYKIVKNKIAPSDPCLNTVHMDGTLLPFSLQSFCLNICNHDKDLHLWQCMKLN